MKRFIISFLACVMGCKNPVKMTDRLYDRYSWGFEFRSFEKKGVFALEYFPFAEFRNKPFYSEYIDIGSNGFRWTPYADRKIWMYGGSTTLGAGSPDDFTIPAYLHISNRGVAAWFSGQEVIDLVESLKSGERPDTVIFYDGINEAICGVRTGLAGVPANYWSLHNYYEGNRSFLREIVARVPIIGRLVHADTDKTSVYRSLSDEQKQKLAERVAKAYLDNVDFALKLSKIYKFKVYFFWQPTLYSDTKSLSKYEQEIWSYQDMAIADMWQRVTPLVLTNPNIIYLNRAFDGIQYTVFMDHCHLLPEGNELVAKEILGYLRHL